MSGVRTEVVAAATGRALRIAAGTRCAVVDVDGGQVGDLFAFCTGDPDEYLSAGHTRARLQRAWPAIGQAFQTNRRRPILTLLSDTSPGIHDLLIPACDAERYRQLGYEGRHASCDDNVRAAMRTLGVELAHVPQPVNVFMDSPVTADGRIEFRPSPSRPGDRIEFRAERDLDLALTSCAMDLTDLNHRHLTDLAVEILEG